MQARAISIKSVGVSRSYPALFKWAPGSGCAINIWEEMVEYDELTINERKREIENSLHCLIAYIVVVRQKKV